MMRNLRLWRPDDNLDRIAQSPLVQQKLRTALSPDELTFLLSAGIVTQENDVGENVVEFLRREAWSVTQRIQPVAEAIYSIRILLARLSARAEADEQRELVQEAEADEHHELVRLKPLGLTPQEERLYRCLERESDHGLTAWEVIEIVYQADPYRQYTPSTEGKYKNRLKTLRSNLNRKLECAKSPSRVRCYSTRQNRFTKGGDLEVVLASRMMLVKGGRGRQQPRS